MVKSDFPKEVKDGVFLEAIYRAIRLPGKPTMIPYDDLFVVIVAKKQEDPMSGR